jgi:hypothetical protein
MLLEEDARLIKVEAAASGASWTWAARAEVRKMRMWSKVWTDRDLKSQLFHPLIARMIARMISTRMTDSGFSEN